jgi:hypothetical protein
MLPLLPEPFPPPPPVLPTEENDINSDWGSVFYVVLIWKQQEGVGRDTKSSSWRQSFWMNPVWKLRMLFSQFVKPRNTIPPFITKLTSITNEDVATAESSPQLAAPSSGLCNNKEVPPVENIILVGLNREYLIYPFLFIN